MQTSIGVVELSVLVGAHPARSYRVAGFLIYNGKSHLTCTFLFRNEGVAAM
jgi:hypothetical protein